MSDKFAMNVTFTAHPGQRDALAGLLLEGAASLESLEDCLLYVVLISDQEPDTVRVNEVWRDAAAHQASLGFEETKAAIQRARPLIAEIEAAPLRPLGGKGL